MLQRISLFLILIFTILCFCPTEVAARRKRARHQVRNELLCAVEPDAMVAKARQERKMLDVAALDLKKKVPYNRFKEGIDVSRYQGIIDWDQVAGSYLISYAYLKATEGASLVDKTYARNLKEAKRVGLSVGSYHFYRPNISWQEQFDNLTSVVKRDEQDLIPIIDIEHRGRVSGKKFIADLEKFIKKVTKHYGKKPLLYTFHNFYNKYLSGCFPDYPWMIARYREDRPILNDGKDYVVWQYTASGVMPGVEGDVDRSKIMGDYSLDDISM
ncbi:MAG: glycosyl hydrolase family 25 [Bacteroidaceae bacterium]|nr:glycosyl hydrolase family 25 [Bacteroidaceae bacterium]